MDNKTPVADVVAQAAKEAGSPVIALQGLRPLPARRGHREEAGTISPPKSRRLPAARRPSRSLDCVASASGWKELARGGRAKSVSALSVSRGFHRRMTRPRFNRILLKLSGEALMGRGPVRHRSGRQLPGLRVRSPRPRRKGHELCLVVGGGNIFRGMAAAAKGFDRATADYMGMLATVMNALALQNALEKAGRRHPRPCRRSRWPRSASPTSAAARCGIWRRAGSSCSRQAPAIPYFTTDTAAALRAAEMGCDALFKGTSVDGVYTADPEEERDATRYDQSELQQGARRRPQGHGRGGGRACAATTISRSSCSTSASPATSPKCSPGRGTATVVQRRGVSMTTSIDKSGPQAPHARRGGSAEA